jgi:hypothetical protein
MPVTVDQEFTQLAIAHAHRAVERNPAVVTQISRNAEARIHEQRSLAFDAYPELHRKTFSVV